MIAGAISQPLLALLSQHQELVTRVHSSFQHACNLSSAHGLITLLAPDKPMNPCSIRVMQQGPLPRLEPGSAVTLRINRSPSVTASHINNYVVLIDDSVTVFVPQLPTGGIGLVNVAVELDQYLANHPKELGIYPLLCQVMGWSCDTKYYSGLMADYFLPHLQGFISQISQTNTELNLNNIIGFGAGLTPSCDDMLVGILAYLDYSQHSYFDVVANACRARVSQTTDVSKAMLELAIARQFNQDIVVFFECLAEGSEIGPALDAIDQYGHSSGHDTLCGIYLAAKLIA